MDDDDGIGLLSAFSFFVPESGVWSIAVSGFGDDAFDGTHGESFDYFVAFGVNPVPAPAALALFGLAGLRIGYAIAMILLLWRGDARLRCITNYFTRMRLVDERGALNFSYTNDLTHVPDGYYPWFLHPQRATDGQRIIFGHWAALNGYINNHNLFGLDSGCAWGRALTLMQLGTHDLFLAQARD